jgi:hypothetical protein
MAFFSKRVKEVRTEALPMHPTASPLAENAPPLQEAEAVEISCTFSEGNLLTINPIDAIIPINDSSLIIERIW